jgi:hypothetical protein
MEIMKKKKRNLVDTGNAWAEFFGYGQFVKKFPNAEIPKDIDKTKPIEVMYSTIKLTSAQWLSLDKTGLNIIDPDGWDRKNYEYSFFEELITKEEFDKRVGFSTIIINK